MSLTRNKQKIIHIGYAKTATTILQKHIFPKACSYSNYTFSGSDSKLDQLTYSHCQRLRYGFNVKKLDIPERTLLSSESLCGWDPHYWEEYAEKNLSAFGCSVHIILVIREPKSLLSSLYVQTCIHEFNGVQDPKYFFLDKVHYADRLPAAKFSLDEFNYARLIDMYKKRFDSVTVIKYEYLKNLSFIQRILSLSDSEINALRIDMLEKIGNKSFSVLSVKIVFFVSKILGFMHLSLSKQNTNDVPVNNGIYGKKENGNNDIFRNFFKRVLLEINLRNFLQGRLDKVIPYKKYVVDFNNVKQVDILCKEYINLPKEVTYIDGKIDYIDY
jgi:hypothetical protein